MGNLFGSDDTPDTPDEDMGAQEWTDTTWEEHPFMVKVGGCGGSIISTSGYGGKGVVLTAAHCLTGKSTVEVMVGRTQTMSGGSTYKAAWWKVHEAYSTSTKVNDIGLVYLKDAIDHRGASAVQVYPAGHAISSGDAIRLLGYYGVEQPGYDCEGCSDSNTLEYTWGHYVSWSTCNANSKVGTICDNDMCIVDSDTSDGLTSTCAGDSGSPAVFQGRQIGLVSRGAGDCDPSVPSIYTNVTYYYDWIDSNCNNCLSAYESTYTSQDYGCGGVGNVFTGCTGTDYTIAHPSGDAANRYIKRLCIWHGAEIDSIQAYYNDGMASSRIGGSGGGQECFDAGSRCFTSVMVKSASRIDALQFTLSDGEKTKQYGGSGGNGPFHENSKVYGYCLSKMQVKAKNTFHRISFTWTRADMDSVGQAFEIVDEAHASNATSEIAIIVSAVLLFCLLVAGAVFSIVKCRNKKKKDALLYGQDEEDEIEVEIEFQEN
mmetsp:Transcript_30617/g.49793  ORF Transcript_30617/g.49793 Transcript_30617/m.49793 type:complete len:486 (+) Transcript_30617:45-1502(+)|eukprot:CAMPEP_0202692734 /NCGR_PEP_ID=MMETSP1385-20130828/7040_1 /ASSEMBLY_ACC=CAM_ASM_000861 /TAXON_ID=933848 /ORGANISM="Elphidium margaritaceum" /LENGTH=485 /DNA_ID=CAMNT_0049348317 /DNA_START=37 /DNA_END=1494 /DNA_ORIENTATION=-